MTISEVRRSRLDVRVENSQTWILTDRLTGSDLGGVTYKHNICGDHYQPWLMVDGVRTEIGMPLSQLNQAAEEIDELTRARTSAKRD